MPAILELWRLAHADLSGDVPRTADYWRWCVRDRPNVGPDNIHVVERAGVAVGYAALADERDVAQVLELVVDPRLSRRQYRRASEVLIDWLEHRAQEVGHDLVRLHVPARTRRLQQVLAARAYAPGELDTPLQWSILDLRRLLCALLSARNGREPPAAWTTPFILEAEPFHRRPGPRWRLRLDPLHARVEPVDDGRAGGHPRLCTDVSTLTALLFGATSLTAELAAGRVEIDPPTATAQAGALLDACTLTAWHIPLADVR